MTIALNHTIIRCQNRHASADFLAAIYGLPEPVDMFHFRTVRLSNGVSLDCAEREDSASPQHDAMLVDEPAFDGILARIQSRGLASRADPARTRPGEIHGNDGGQGLCFEDPDGHVLEALTVSYGGFPGKDDP